MSPVVSVITPTWRRHGLLLERCVPSVAAQTRADAEHVVVSDGPDPELAALLPAGVVYRELPEHAPGEHWGHAARLAGLEASAGELITYVDDDDALRPEHCALLAAALEEDPGAGFACSRMVTHRRSGDSVLGSNPPRYGDTGTPMLMHRRSVLEHGTWGPASACEDWDLVARWIAAGIAWVHVPVTTVDVWPSDDRQVPA